MLEIILLIIKCLLCIFGALLAGVFLTTGLLYIIKKPTHNRKWEKGQEKLAHFVFQKNNINQIKIENVRDYDWEKGTSKWLEKNINVKDIVGLDVAVVHFLSNKNIGHIFLIFNFKNGDGLGISIEPRRDDREHFLVIEGFLLNYEILYVVATKKDLLGLRRKNKEPVYLYPINISAKQAQKLFLVLAKRQNKIYEKPEFYHPIINNCSNSIVRALRSISDRKFPFLEANIFPGKAGEVLFRMGLIKTNETDFSKVQKKFLIK